MASGDLSLLVDDLQALQPTILCAVPRLLTRIHDKVTSQLGSRQTAKTPSLSARLLETALKQKLANWKRSRTLGHVLFDLLVFRSVKQALGFGCLHTLISGGAPLPTDTMDFFRVLMGPSCVVSREYNSH